MKAITIVVSCFLALSSCKTVKSIELDSTLTRVEFIPPNPKTFPQGAQTSEVSFVTVTYTEGTESTATYCDGEKTQEFQMYSPDSTLSKMSIKVLQECGGLIQVTLEDAEKQAILQGEVTILSSSIRGKARYSTKILLSPTPLGIRLGFLEKLELDMGDMQETDISIGTEIDSSSLDVSNFFQVESFNRVPNESQEEANKSFKVEINLVRDSSFSHNYEAQCYLNIFYDVRNSSDTSQISKKKTAQLFEFKVGMSNANPVYDIPISSDTISNPEIVENSIKVLLDYCQALRSTIDALREAN